MARIVGSKLISRTLLLISSVSVFSLLALTKCGLGGLVDDSDPSLMEEGIPAFNIIFLLSISFRFHLFRLTEGCG